MTFTMMEPCPDRCVKRPGHGVLWFLMQLRPVLPPVAVGQLADLLLELLGQLGLFQPPAPVLAHGGGLIDAGGVVQPQPVLHGDDAGRRCAAQDQCDHAFIELLLQQSWTNPNFFPPPNQRSKCPQNGRFGCHPCS